MTMLRRILEESPIIAAVSTKEDIEKCAASECRVVFIIRSTLTSVEPMVKEIKASGRIAIVHADLVAGLSSKEVSMEFLSEQVHADGIISTKPALVKRAKELDMIGILRAFIIDTAALETTKRQIELIRPDAVELMPGIVPRVFTEMRGSTEIPLIAGGLIKEKSDVLTAFDAGVDAVSATKHDIWFM